MKFTTYQGLLFMFSLLLGFSCKAQPKDSLLTELSRKWADSKEYALKIAASMPENEYDFKPVSDEMSFREQLLHLAGNIQWLTSGYLFVSSPKRLKSSIPPDKKAVLKIISDAYDLGMQAHEHLLPAQLEEHVNFFAGPLTRRQVLLLMHDHQTHHLGQLIVYLRLKGVKPPEYIGW